MFKADSGKATPVNLIPAGTLAFVNVGATVKASKETNGLYFNLELTILKGPYKGRKVFEILPFPGDPRNSVKWVEMGATNLCRLFETAGVFVPGDEESYAQFNHLVLDEITAIKPDENGRFVIPANLLTNLKAAANEMAHELNALTAAVKIKIEEAEEDSAYPSKNKVGEWLSSNPASGGHKKYLELVQQGDQAAEAARGGAMRPPGSAKAKPAAGGVAAKPAGKKPDWIGGKGKKTEEPAAGEPATNAAAEAEQNQESSGDQEESGSEPLEPGDDE